MPRSPRNIQEEVRWVSDRGRMREPYSVRKSDTHRARVKMFGLARQNVSCARAPDVQSAAVFPLSEKRGRNGTCTHHQPPPEAN